MKNPIEVWRERSTPFRELRQLQKEMDQLFAETLWPEFGAAPFNPSCELSEDSNAIRAKFDLPGVDKADIKIEISDGVLSLTMPKTSAGNSQRVAVQ